MSGRGAPPEIQQTAPRHRCVDYDECCHLTQHDLDMLADLALGLTYKEIALKRRIPHKTVKTRVFTLRERLGMTGRTVTGLVAKAHQLKIITIPQYRKPPPVIITSMEISLSKRAG